MAVRTRLTGYDLLNDRRLNKGTAFTEAERDAFALHGLLPPYIGTLEDQVARRWKALADVPTPFGKYCFMRDLQDANETLFYALMLHRIEDTVPIVYTPTVGEGCRRFSEIWRKPRGLFLSYPNRERIDRILSHPRHDPVRCIVVSDGERILGLGDQGAGGMGIPIGKLALYTALAGIAPESCLPILLDVGTDNAERLADPLYVGWRHERVRGQPYDDFVAAFVAAVKRRWPHVLLQWEDFAGANAARLLDRYHDELCTFNDDIQGTAAVVASALLSAISVTGTALAEQRILVLGFGSAGLGIARFLASLMRDAGLSEREACERFYPVDRQGLLVDDDPDLAPPQRPFARRRAEVAPWLPARREVSLLEVMRHARPTVLIGVSGQHGAFAEDAVREMARHVDRPVIFALSNPTSRCEATAQQLVDWTEGRAIVGTGSPSPPPTANGRVVRADQINNSYIFPGLALGIIASRAQRVSAGMLKAAAMALAGLAPVRKDPAADILPPLASMRAVSRVVATAVGEAAMREGLASVDRAAFQRQLAANIWEPVYEPYELAVD